MNLCVQSLLRFRREHLCVSPGALYQCDEAAFLSMSIVTTSQNLCFPGNTPHQSSGRRSGTILSLFGSHSRRCEDSCCSVVCPHLQLSGALIPVIVTREPPQTEHEDLKRNCNFSPLDSFWSINLDWSIPARTPQSLGGWGGEWKSLLVVLCTSRQAAATSLHAEAGWRSLSRCCQQRLRGNGVVCEGFHLS